MQRRRSVPLSVAESGAPVFSRRSIRAGVYFKPGRWTAQLDEMREGDVRRGLDRRLLTEYNAERGWRRAERVSTGWRA